MTQEIIMNAVYSSNIAKIGFYSSLIEGAGDLYIEFSNGKTYKYEGVPEKLASDLWRTPSKGSFFAKYIKNIYPATLAESIKNVQKS